MVVRNGGAVALVEVRKSTSEPLFCDVDDIVLLAGPDETVYLHRPELDTGVPSEIVKAVPDAGGARCVVVEGRYGHVSFVLDPTPLQLHVLDVAPPWPAKLLDQVGRVLDTAEDLPDIAVVGHVVELPDLLPEEPAEHYLLQCRGGGMDVAGRHRRLPRRGPTACATGRCSAAPAPGRSTTTSTATSRDTS